MPFVLLNNAQMSVSGTPGTGTITLSAATAGFQTFASAGITNTDTSYFMATDGSDWELFLGTYTSSGTTLARTTRLSSSSGSAISLTSSAVITAVAPSQLLTSDVQTFTSSGTWTKPDWARQVQVICIGGGGGGGSGRRSAASSDATGGGGGSAAAITITFFEASALPSTVTVTIGAGGAGGTAITADSTNGNSGSAGGATTFGSLTRAAGGAASGGGNASTFNINGGVGATQVMLGYSGGDGGFTSNGAGANGIAPSSGGGMHGAGGGGGITAANVASAGGAGGNSTTYSNVWGTSTGMGTAGAIGSAGGAGSQITGFISGSGGGGGSSLAAAGGNGGAGGIGGGGGGGGASRNGNNSGAGGAGGDGACYVISRP